MTIHSVDDVRETRQGRTPGSRPRLRTFGATLVLSLWGLAASAQAVPLPRLPALTSGQRDSREARQIADTVWKRVLVRCGRDRVFALESRHQRPMLFRKLNFRFEATTDQLTPAQRANGVQWQGGFFINAPLFRIYAGPERPGEAQSGWEPWQDNYTDSIQAGFDLRKFKGVWQMREHDAEAFAPFDPTALKINSLSCGPSGEPRLQD